MEQIQIYHQIFSELKTKSITITDEWYVETHLELHGHLDYLTKCPKM